MNMFNLVKEIFKPAADLIDNLHTSEEEKLVAKSTMMELYTSFLGQALEFEQARLQAQAQIVVAEAKADSWLTRSWRPITMLWLLALVSAWWLGYVDHERLTEDIVLSAFNLVKIGVGGYIASRGVEKVAPAVVEAFKKKELT